MNRYSILTVLMLCLFGLESTAQTSLNVELIYQEFIDTLEINYRDSYYSECWGMTVEDHDYAVISSTAGTHFYDVTDPDNIFHAEFVPAAVSGFNANWRDYHDYLGFCYTVNDGVNGTLQIINMNAVPGGGSLSVSYDSDALFSRAHNIFIDTANAVLYVCGGNTIYNEPFDLALYDISNPIDPILINTYAQFGYIHDVYVRDNIAYLESPNQQTMYVVDFAEPLSPVTLGSISNYPQAGYTHAGWLSEDGNHYILTDETYASSLKMLDVSDLGDIEVTDLFSSYVSDSSMVHNVIIQDEIAYVSYYNDGLQVFDISDKSNVVRIGYYDTYVGPLDGGYRGAWGVYPFSADKVIICDRQTGIYVLDASEAVNSTIEPPVAGFVPTVPLNGCNIEFVNTSSGDITSYSWDFGDNIGTSTDENPEYCYLESDSYTVCLTVENGGGTDTYCEEIYANIGTSIEEVKSLLFNIYPNPTTSFFTINSEELFSSVEIFDLSGKWVHTVQNAFPTNELKIALPSNLATGTYTVQIDQTYSKTIQIK